VRELATGLVEIRAVAAVLRTAALRTAVVRTAVLVGGADLGEVFG
jgi:hypothetical protein